MYQAMITFIAKILEPKRLFSNNKQLNNAVAVEWVAQVPQVPMERMELMELTENKDPMDSPVPMHPLMPRASLNSHLFALTLQRDPRDLPVIKVLRDPLGKLAFLQMVDVADLLVLLVKLAQL